MPVNDTMSQLKERAIKFIVNPVSGNGRSRRVLPKLVGVAKKLGVNFDLQFTQAPEHATEIAKDQSGDFDVMVAVGGDGTVNEVAAGVIKGEKVMGVIPTGTGNDFAHAIGRLRTLHDYLKRIAYGRIKTIDVGNIRIDNNDLLFVNGLGIGFDAEVARESLSVHRLRGITRYLYALLKTLSKYKSPNMRIEIDGRVIDGKTFLIAVGNGTSAGGGFLLTPAASLDDGLLDTCIVSDVSIKRVLQVLPSVLNGTHAKHPEVTMIKTGSMKIESDIPVTLHRDGEIPPSKTSRMEIKVVPNCLKITV